MVGRDVTVTLASGWRLVTPEERAELGALAGDASVRLIAVGKAKDEGNVPTLVIAGGELTTDVSDEAVYADSVQQLEKPFPGFHLIDDFEWPMTPQGARWRTGVYILDNVSLTLSQLAWITRTAHVGSRSSQRFLWTATCTCPSIVFPMVIDDFMEMAQTLEVPS